MSQKAFNWTVAPIFLAILVLHILRLVYGWEAVIGGVAIPMWASWVALVVAGYLAYEAITLAKKS